MLTEGQLIAEVWREPCRSAGTALNTYLAQLERAAADAGVDLAEACEQEGVAKTTFQRWKKGEVHPREATAKAVLQRIKTMAKRSASSEEAA